MNIGNVILEYKEEVARLRDERDVLRQILIDEIQFGRQLAREAATRMVDMEVFQKLQRIRP